MSPSVPPTTQYCTGVVLLLRARKQSRRPHRPQLPCALSALGIQCVCAVLADVAGPYVCVSFSFSFWRGCMCISTQQLVRIFDGGDWDKSYSSGIWDGKNDSTIGNEMVSEWTDSGKWDGRKSVKVGSGNGMGSEWIVAREEGCCCCCCFSHSAHWLPTRKKTTLHGGQSRSWSAEQGKKKKKKVWQRTPPPPPPPPARCSFGEKNKK